MADRPEPERPDRHSSERAPAREEALIDERVRAAYRQPPAGEDAARERVLARLAEARSTAREPGATGLRWWFAADAFHARPAWVLAAFVAVLAAGAWVGARFAGPWGGGRDAERVVLSESTGAAEGTAPVTFVLRAPGATRVSVVGDFNNWDAEATPMAHSGSGDLWVLNLRLPRGVHLYSFVLDGSEWRPDPSAPLAADGSFGGHNSVIVVDGARGL